MAALQNASPAPRTSQRMKCALWLEDSIYEKKPLAAVLRAESSELFFFPLLIYLFKICLFIIEQQRQKQRD